MIPLSRTTHLLWTIRNGTAEVDRGEMQKGACFLVFVRRVIPMQVLIRPSSQRWLIIPEVRPLLRRTMTDGIRLPRFSSGVKMLARGLVSFVY